MILTDAQKIIAKDLHRFRVLCCGRRFGKTTLAIDTIKGRACIPNSHVCYIAPTYQQARDIAWSQLKADCQQASDGNINEARLEIKLVNGSLIFLRGWEAIETLRGQHFDLIVLDEVASMRNFWLAWEEVLRPTLTDTRGEAVFISTPKGYDHFYELYSKDMEQPPVNGVQQDLDFKSFHFTSYDNPFVPKDELDKARTELPDDRFEQEYMASFKHFTGLVYKEFDRERHVYSDKKENKNYRIFNTVDTMGGVDFGFTNPSALLKIERDTDNNYYVTEEWYKTEKTTPQIIEVARSFNCSKYYPDPAEPDRIEEMRKAHLNIREVSKDIEAGIIAVRELFRANRLFVHKSCTNLIRELETYRYPERKAERNEPELPIKENDHACFTADTIIINPFGKILGRVSTGVKDVYEFMGSKVTGDHPYLTRHGFVRLDSLRDFDIVVVWKNKSLMELSLGDIPTQTGVSLKIILYLLQRNLQVIKQNACTGIYGKNIMVKYLKVFIFIIKMVIQQIMIYLTSNWYQGLNTAKNIVKSVCRYGEKILRKLRMELENGIIPQKNFINGWGNKHGKIKNGFLKIVLFVEKNIQRLSQLEVNTVIKIVKPKLLGKEEVFATITDNGYFLANGVLVSNCDALRYVLYMQVGKQRDTYANIHYSSSSMPMQNKPQGQSLIGSKVKKAFTYFQKL